MHDEFVSKLAGVLSPVNHSNYIRADHVLLRKENVVPVYFNQNAVDFAFCGFVPHILAVMYAFMGVLR